MDRTASATRRDPVGPLDVCILTLGASVVAWYLAGLLLGGSYAHLSTVAVPLGLIVGALAVRRVTGRADGRARDGRRDHPMPYLIAVATALLPVAAIAQDRGDDLVLTVAGLLVTALLIVRQLVAQRRTDRLLSELVRGRRPGLLQTGERPKERLFRR